MERLNRNHLKIIACVTMLIDHAAAAFFIRGAARTVLRLVIGRVAFPLYSLLLVEGLFHTHSRIRYVLRILLFAFISEIPYDLLFEHRVFYPEDQNILFLLFLGLIMFSALDAVRSRGSLHIAAAALLQAGVVAGAAAAARFLRFNYGIAGIAMLAAMYYVYVFTGGAVRSYVPRPGRRELSAAPAPADGAAEDGPDSPAPSGPNKIKRPLPAVIAGAAALNIGLQICSGGATPGAFLAAVPAAFYNEKRGRLNLKYFFYFYYPVHLTVLLLILLKLRPWYFTV